jgi:hypothetical protein
MAITSLQSSILDQHSPSSSPPPYALINGLQIADSTNYSQRGKRSVTRVIETPEYIDTKKLWTGLSQDVHLINEDNKRLQQLNDKLCIENEKLKAEHEFNAKHRRDLAREVLILKGFHEFKDDADLESKTTPVPAVDSGIQLRKKRKTVDFTMQTCFHCEKCAQFKVEKARNLQEIRNQKKEIKSKNELHRDLETYEILQ